MTSPSSISWSPLWRHHYVRLTTVMTSHNSLFSDSVHRFRNLLKKQNSKHFWNSENFYLLLLYVLEHATMSAPKFRLFPISWDKRVNWPIRILYLFEALWTVQFARVNSGQNSRLIITPLIIDLCPTFLTILYESYTQS